jgi:hypothetical protein
MKIKTTVLTLSAVFLAICSTALTAETLSYPDLVARLYDMKRLATLPVAGEKSGNFSSWDRGAKYNAQTGKYDKWWANADGNGFMDREKNMMKMDGPGVIWRIWSAKPTGGNLEFYIDGSKKPTVALPFIDMFTKAPFSNYPELVHMKARGQNFFIPIPFQKSIRIRGDKGWGKFYQITYTKFPAGTKVPSFTGTFSDQDAAALKKANDIWSKRGPQLFASDKAETLTETVTVKPGAEVTLAKYSKPGAIVSITMARPKMDREASIDILRELAISINWDAQKAPSVWAPLGDFFGTGAGENLYRSLVTGMTKEKYYANWYMPFEQAEITIRNDGKEARKLTFTIHTEKVADVKNLLRYHCKWQRDDFSGLDKKRFSADRWPDWPVVRIDKTAGRFCGFHMHIWNPHHLWNKALNGKYAKPLPEGEFFAKGKPAHQFYTRQVMKHYWWGEGDEKFFVDDEKMPSTFGTGSEDYFGYAWGTAAAYDSALQAQPRNGSADEIGKSAGNAGPGNIGHICVLRWQIADNVPFQKQFEAVIEKYHPNSWPLLNAMTASWYQMPGTVDHYQPKPITQRKDYYAQPKPPAIVNGRW